jgi:hypothetical protein
MLLLLVLVGQAVVVQEVALSKQVLLVHQVKVLLAVMVEQKEVFMAVLVVVVVVLAVLVEMLMSLFLKTQAVLVA